MRKGEKKPSTEKNKFDLLYDLVQKNKKKYRTLYYDLKKEIEKTKKPVKFRGKKKDNKFVLGSVLQKNQNATLVGNWNKKTQEAEIFLIMPVSVRQSDGRIKKDKKSAVIGKGTYARVKRGVKISVNEKDELILEPLAIKIIKIGQAKSKGSEKKCPEVIQLEVSGYLQGEVNSNPTGKSYKPFTIENTAYLPMTKYPGEDLKSLLEKKEKKGKRKKEKNSLILTLAEKLEIFKKVAEKVLEIHKLGFNHGDLKPENIIVYVKRLHSGKASSSEKSSTEIKVNLIDSAAISHKNRNNNNVYQGTPYYMPPEIKLDEKVEVKVAGVDQKKIINGFCSVKYDSFSLGVILGLMLGLKLSRLEKKSSQADLRFAIKDLIANSYSEENKTKNKEEKINTLAEQLFEVCLFLTESDSGKRWQLTEQVIERIANISLNLNFLNEDTLKIKTFEEFKEVANSFNGYQGKQNSNSSRIGSKHEQENKISLCSSAKYFLDYIAEETSLNSFRRNELSCHRKEIKKNKDEFIKLLLLVIDLEIQEFRKLNRLSGPLEKVVNKGILNNVDDFKKCAFDELKHSLNSSNLDKKLDHAKYITTAIINVAVTVRAARTYLSIANPELSDKGKFIKVINSFGQSQVLSKKIGGASPNAGKDEFKNITGYYTKLESKIHNLVYSFLNAFGFKDAAQRYKFQNKSGLFYHKISEGLSKIKENVTTPEPSDNEILTLD